MVENISAEIIAGGISLGLCWVFLPSYILLKPKVVDKLCKFVPGKTPDDLVFYWNHWAIRLTLAWFSLGVGTLLWEQTTGGSVHVFFEATVVAMFLVLLTYIGRGKWRQWRQTKLEP